MNHIITKVGNFYIREHSTYYKKMSETKPKYNSTFTELKRWKQTEKSDLVLSLITDNDTGEHRYFLNKQWTGKDGKLNRGNGSTVPKKFAIEVADAIKADVANR